MLDYIASERRLTSRTLKLWKNLLSIGVIAFRVETNPVESVMLLFAACLGLWQLRSENICSKSWSGTEDGCRGTTQGSI